MNLPSDFLYELQDRTDCDIKTDPSTRWLYSTDASIYQIEPLGVAFPHTLDDLAGAVTLAAQYRIPILARGAGSSLAGQAIGAALILDCSRYLTKIGDINLFREKDTAIGGTVTVEPGVVLNTLNRAVAPHGLQFGPDPASAERATLGGSLANNATGAHSILYGMSADHLLSAEVILSDGTVTHFYDREYKIYGNSNTNSIEANIFSAASTIRENYADLIKSRWPRVWRRASGYNLNYLLPWSPAIPPGWQSNYNPQAIYNYLPSSHSKTNINLAPLLAGSEGTLAIIRKATLQLVPLPRYTILCVLVYRSLPEACDAVPDLLVKYHPSAVELISQMIIQLARSVPAYASQLSWVDEISTGGAEPVALLVVEFSGDDYALLRSQSQAMGKDVYIADSQVTQKHIWTVRKVGLGLLQSRPGPVKPATFIEDLAVPVERLGEFVREMGIVMDAHHTKGDFYAHASAGCLHFRPMLNLNSSQGIIEMRAIAEEAVNLVLRLGGTTSGEHGDGLSRSEWLERAYGPEIVKAFRILKSAADPFGILNPGKIIDPPKMDENLRGNILPARVWTPIMSFERDGGSAGADGLSGAIELCNGAGVCRKSENVMCPSFQATQDEAFSTRGRANLLRAILSEHRGESATIPDSVTPGQVVAPLLERKVWESIDLCLACKGCKSECPSGVDMAKIKYEYMNHYYATHRRRLRDYLFGYIGVVAPIGTLVAPLLNWMMRRPETRRVMDRYFGLTCKRPFPRFKSPFHHQATYRLQSHGHDSKGPVLLLRDTFNHYFFPDVEAAALKLFASVGVNVITIPVLGAGRTLISKGFLEPAKRHLARLMVDIQKLDPEGITPIVGLEPSEIYTLRDEFLDFFPGNEHVMRIAQRAWMIDEFFTRLDFRFRATISPSKIYLHGHCYQKSRPPAPDGKPVGIGASASLLRSAGYKVELIDDGCCGMAGAFGYESDHYEVSMKVGELILFPTLRARNNTEEDIIVAAPGVSCRSQIEDGTGISPFHPIQLITPL